MRKAPLVLAAAAVLGLTAVAAPSPAEAQHWRGRRTARRGFASAHSRWSRAQRLSSAKDRASELEGGIGLKDVCSIRSSARSGFRPILF